MRLIETTTLEMREFFPPHIPPYSILSHTWGVEEVSLVEYTATASSLAKAKSPKRGFKKILRAAKLARDLRHKYIWIDTCCIDKSSSADLTEAINSMYQWYHDAVICFAFLEDLRREEPSKAMARCRWFTRGWTLQELVAPRRLDFYDANWICRGSKITHIDLIFERTGLPRRILLGHTSPTSYSLARRMSWAATRETTRTEDTAYCLLGIFDINMPLAYGEGPKAFRRLQEEIVKKNSDLTIFAWRSPPISVPAIRVTGATGGNGAHTSSHKPTPVDIEPKPVFQPMGSTPGWASPAFSRAASPATPSPNEKNKRHSVSPSPSSAGTPLSTANSAANTTVSTSSKQRDRPELCLFAPSPAQFAEFASLHPFVDDFESFAVTNRGLSVSGTVYLRLVSKPSTDGSTPAIDQYLLLVGSQFDKFVGIYLIKIGPNLFQRDWDADMAMLKKDEVLIMRGFLVMDWYILIDKRPTDSITPETFRQASVRVPPQGYGNKYIRIKDTAPTHLWDVQDRLFVRPKAYAWTRYDMVLAMKCTVALRDVNQKVPDTPDAIIISRRVNFVVLCQYRFHMRDPQFNVFLEEDYPRETEMIMVRRAPNNSFMWPDLDVICPHLTKLPDHVMVDVGERSARTGKWRSCWYRISIIIKKEKTDLCYAEPELYNVYFDIKQVDHDDPADTKTDTKAVADRKKSS